MSSEAAQKAYPEKRYGVFAAYMQEGFDRGAVEARRELVNAINERLDRLVHVYGGADMPVVTERKSLRDLYGEEFVDDIEAILREAGQ